MAGVLPGVSGGVLCVMFGIYETAMELLAEPVKCFKTYVPKLIPFGIGAVIGFLGVAKLLSFLLERYPAPSLCVFVGLVAGMMVSSTIMIIPFESFTTSLISLILNLICIIAGFVSAQIMTGINISKD